MVEEEGRGEVTWDEGAEEDVFLLVLEGWLWEVVYDEGAEDDALLKVGLKQVGKGIEGVIDELALNFQKLEGIQIYKYI